ncbi:type II toxin-antitoxin system VapC family toxin [Thiorhodococcus minor]|uniref:Type II toxin-antitoxin system VapC family toxin n=1 Tax=Thiorhodococcus minor TaxID=57489 RepID=A0A6M0K5A8_9GAMM|nr:type II toxin-antitoxin system VapC family toxin [Thiorhodococcus minor]NEV64619.1 type II toxin-antitoxin system VapC family toxin [Thiorhodococcus minor]
MRVLTDTHILLWALLQPERLDEACREALESPEHRVFFSAVNIWEIAMKRTLDRPDFDVDPEAVHRAALETGFHELPMSALHAAAVRDLPAHHRDPFDRLLIAQARTELLMTDDPLIGRYPVERIGMLAAGNPLQLNRASTGCYPTGSKTQQPS